MVKVLTQSLIVEEKEGSIFPLVSKHWSTFADRFGAFPAKVELLSRFRSPREQKAVVEGLRRGTVDVVIGTHR